MTVIDWQPKEKANIQERMRKFLDDLLPLTNLDPEYLDSLKDRGESILDDAWTYINEWKDLTITPQMMALQTNLKAVYRIISTVPKSPDNAFQLSPGDKEALEIRENTPPSEEVDKDSDLFIQSEFS